MSALHRSRTLLNALLLGFCIIPMAGCATKDSVLNDEPAPASITVSNEVLRLVPEPKKRTVVAVYDIEDLTGQFKERDNVQSLSRAVTQGGAAILIKALQDAGERRWFTVLERKELDNLLRERQIVTEMRRIYKNENRIEAGVLPPLFHAGIIIEGGIIGYDTNTVTGGAGARFLGIGGDAKYLKDVVTVTLRAVSTKTGEVLTSVTTRKTVASYSLQGGAFRYVKLDEILEAEAGITYNEPKQIAVQSALEEAVVGIIVEGAELGVWNFKDPNEGTVFIEAYRQKKYEDEITVAAIDPPKPLTDDAAKLQPTKAGGSAPASSAARPSRVGPTSTSGRSLPGPVTRPAGQSGVRQVPGVGFVPSNTDTSPVPRAPEANAPPVLPPAPAPEEPALGSIEKVQPPKLASLEPKPSN